MNRQMVIARIIVLFIGMAFPYSASADKIVFGSGDWCPYVCDPSLHDGKFGYLPDMAKIIFENAGHLFEMQYMPYSRALEYAKEGRVNGIPGVYRGDAPDFIFPAAPQGIGESTFYVQKGSTWKYEGAASLQTLASLGVILNYFYGDVVTEFAGAFPDKMDILSGEAPQERSLKKLQAGRISAWIEDNRVAEYNIMRSGLEGEIVPAGGLGEKQFVYIAFSPANSKSAEYARLIEQGVEQLRQSGELAKILAVYGLKDWKEESN